MRSRPAPRRRRLRGRARAQGCRVRLARRQVPPQRRGLCLRARQAGRQLLRAQQVV